MNVEEMRTEAVWECERRHRAPTSPTELAEWIDVPESVADGDLTAAKVDEIRRRVADGRPALVISTNPLEDMYDAGKLCGDPDDPLLTEPMHVVNGRLVADYAERWKTAVTRFGIERGYRVNAVVGPGESDWTRTPCDGACGSVEMQISIAAHIWADKRTAGWPTRMGKA